jgi:hypothetical protein
LHLLSIKMRTVFGSEYFIVLYQQHVKPDQSFMGLMNMK